VTFNSTFQYIEDVLSINNDQFHLWGDSISPLNFMTNGMISTLNISTLAIFHHHHDIGFISKCNSLFCERSIFQSRHVTHKQVDVTWVYIVSFTGSILQSICNWKESVPPHMPTAGTEPVAARSVTRQYYHKNKRPGPAGLVSKHPHTPNPVIDFV
jgi:hypothetical protein